MTSSAVLVIVGAPLLENLEHPASVELLDLIVTSTQLYAQPAHILHRSLVPNEVLADSVVAKFVKDELGLRLFLAFNMHELQPFNPRPKYSPLLYLHRRLKNAFSCHTTHGLTLAINVTLCLDDLIAHLITLFYLLEDCFTLQLASFGALLAEPRSQRGPQLLLVEANDERAEPGPHKHAVGRSRPLPLLKVREQLPAKHQLDSLQTLLTVFSERFMALLNYIIMCALDIGIDAFA